MPKQKTVQTKLTEQDQKAYSNSFMVVHDQVLMPWVCEELMLMFDRLPIVEVEETHQSSFVTKDPEMQDQNHRYEHQDRIHGNIYPGTQDFADIFDLIEFALPKGYEFATVNYVQFIKYPEGSHFPWHMDEADAKDTGTSLLFLNDNFVGGHLTVAGHKFANKQGTIVAFNNSTSTWHGVEPVLSGARYVLAIWYGKPDLEEDLFRDDVTGQPRNLTISEINKLNNQKE
jgi:hypothetical protein